MPLLLGPNDREILMMISVLLAEDHRLSPKVLSSFLEDLGIHKTPEQVGWWIKKTQAFKKHRRGTGAVWIPVPSRLRHLYEQFDLQ
jgi:CheY-like chemotaxis protein